MQAIFCASSNLLSQASLIQTPKVQTQMSEMSVCLKEVAVLKSLCLEQLSTFKIQYIGAFTNKSCWNYFKGE